MTAQLIDLRQTAENRHAARTTGQTARVKPVLITLRIGDYVIDGDSGHAGNLSQYVIVHGHQKAVIQGHGFQFAANLIDLAPCPQPRLFGDR